MIIEEHNGEIKLESTINGWYKNDHYFAAQYLFLRRLIMKKILIIEDEKSIAELEQDYLEINGFQTEMAHTGDMVYRRH